MENNEIIYVSKYSMWRRILQVFFGVKNDDTPLTPYFKYELNIRHHQNNLCFDKEPSKILYENSIFGLLSNFTSITGAINCLKYHFALYDEKDTYLEFFRYELPARIKSSSSKSTKIIFEGCLDWVTEQIQVYQLEPIYIGSKASIETHFEPKILVALLKFIIKDCKSDIGSRPAFTGTDMGIGLLLTHFTPFQTTPLGSLQKDVGKLKPEHWISEELREKLKELFLGK
jgi:hypothetical protein